MVAQSRISTRATLGRLEVDFLLGLDEVVPVLPDPVDDEVDVFLPDKAVDPDALLCLVKCKIVFKY